MGELLAQTVPLSLAAAISPLVLMGVLALLGGEHGTRRAVAYTLGFTATATALIGAGLALVAVRSGHAGGDALGSPAADVVTGVVLIAFAALMVRPKRKADGDRASEHHRQWIKPNAPLAMFAVFGAAIMLVNVSTIVMLLAVLREIAKAHATTGEAAVALGIADVCTSLPATLPLAAALFGGAALAAKVQELGTWTNRNGKYILAALFLVFGLQDVLKAFGH